MSRLIDFVTELIVLATSCNFRRVKNYSLRYRITCEIEESTLRQDLLKVQDLYLDQYLRVCCASELCCLKKEVKQKQGVQNI